MTFLKTRTKRVIFAVVLFIFVLLARHICNNQRYFYMPEAKKIEIGHLLENPQLSSQEQELLFCQTGLSPYALDEMQKTGRMASVQMLHKGIFVRPQVKKNYIFFPFTVEEYKKGSLTPLANLKDGDVLITFNTHTLDWRHGHCAIVTDAENGILLEHAAVGKTSYYGKTNDWGRYAAFAILRYSDGSAAKKAAEYAKERLVDIDYSVFAGLIKKDKSKEKEIDSSHCAHIVWQAYKAVGIDIDSDRGAIVTTMDLAMSDKLKVVQIYGLDPKCFKERMLR